MDLSTGFLIYAAVFRLSVIAVGVVAIVLGYLLFVRATVAHGRTEAGLEIAEFKLNLKNAAPGTCFAAFGAGIILAMLVGGSPSLTLKTAQGAASSDKLARVVKLKGNGQAQFPNHLTNSLAEAALRLRNGDDPGAMAGYSAVLKTPGLSAAEAALALEPMARIALLRGDHEQAETLARLAVLFSTGAPATMDTLARTLIARERPVEAVTVARQAVAAIPDDPRFLHTLALGLAGAGERDEAARVLDQAARLDAVYGAERMRLLGASQ
jgi:Flp pilus assembly protein TadD